jgi:hypothetical protein
MKKFTAILMLLWVVQLQAQTVKGIQKGKLVGVIFYDANDKEVNRIEPAYEEIQVYVKTQIGGINLGVGFVESRYWHDSEYIEVPIDPNDPTLTRVDTFIHFQRAYHVNKPIIAKKDGKYGILNEKGNELVGLEHTSYFASMDLIGYQNDAQKPLLLMQNGNKLTLYDASLKVILTDAQLPNNFSKLSRKEEALALLLFGENLLINEGGLLVDSIIKVPAKKETVKGKVVIKEKAYSYPVYYYKGGKFNVLNLQTGALLWPESKADILITAFDENGKPHFENLNPRNIKSIILFQNSSHKINPASFEFK